MILSITYLNPGAKNCIEVAIDENGTLQRCYEKKKYRRVNKNEVIKKFKLN